MNVSIVSHTSFRIKYLNAVSPISKRNEPSNQYKHCGLCQFNRDLSPVHPRKVMFCPLAEYFGLWNYHKPTDIYKSAVLGSKATFEGG